MVWVLRGGGDWRHRLEDCPPGVLPSAPRDISSAAPLDPAAHQCCSGEETGHGAVGQACTEVEPVLIPSGFWMKYVRDAISASDEGASPLGGVHD